MQLRVIDTFAGAGGFSLGFQLAGAKILGAIEIDEWASDTFRYNHPGARVLTTDIEKISDTELLEAFKDLKPNVILGGPPCQGFSVCRREADDSSDPRNTLFEEFLRIGDILKPQYMIMENVPNLVKARTKSQELVIDIILKELDAMGFDVDFRVLEATNFGVPQIRKRLFVVATKTPLTAFFPQQTHGVDDIHKQEDLFGRELKQTPMLWDAISDLPEINAREGAEEMAYDKKPQNDYQEYLRKKAKVVFNHKAMKHSKRMVERFSVMKCGDTVNDVPEAHRPLKRNGGGKVAKAGYDQNNRRLHPDKPSHTIPASFYANFVHPYKNRNFTPREGARIQSFPDTYRFLGKPTVVSKKLLEREGRAEELHLCQYNQIGNAVPPLLSKAIAVNIQAEGREG